MSVKVSVVVPVYNTGKYLRQCIDSLINQTLKEIEIILVDDGSTDDSVEIIDEYQKKDTRIQLYRQKNQYAGAARNNGMTHATGQYIIFLDSDDFFAPRMLEKMYKEAQKSCADIAVCGWWYYDEQAKKVISGTKPSRVGILSPKDLGNGILTYFTPEPWTKLYNRQFVVDSGLQFQSIKNTNDVFFTRMSVILAKTICIVPAQYVYYRSNNASSLQGAFSDVTYCFGDALTALKFELIVRRLWDDVIAESFYYSAATMIQYYSNKACTFELQKQFYVYCKQLVEKIVIDSSDRVHIQEESILNAFMEDSSFDRYLYQILTLKNNTLQNSLKQTTMTIRDIKRSFSYKLSSMLTFIPRKVKLWLKKHK